MAELGLRVLDDGAGDTVTAQMPSAGAVLHTGGQVMLYTYTEEVTVPDTLICVPDVSGQSMAQAATLLRQRGLDMEISGSGFATIQEPAADEFVQQGTIVRVTFEMPSP